MTRYLGRNWNYVFAILTGMAIVAIISFQTCRSYNRAVRLEKAEVKAKKFDEYCQFVRVNLETTLSIFKNNDPNALAHTKRFRQNVANEFYSELLQIDKIAVVRCSEPELSTSAMYSIRNRCEVPTLCAAEGPDHPGCQVKPECLTGVIEELLNHLPERIRD